MGWIMGLAAAGACAALGFRAADRLGSRETMLKRWDAALSRMEIAVSQGGAALTEVLRRGAGDGVPLLCRLAEDIESAPAQSPRDFIAPLPWDRLLTAPEQETLAECLEAMFSSVPESQARALALARRWLKADLKDAREKREKNGRLYVSLGWLAGAAAFILLC